MTENYTKYLYDICYNIVDESKMPIVVPSYNRFSPDFINLLKSNYNNDINYPVFVIVRESQKANYIESIGDYPNINIIAVEDNLIRNTGLVRRYISKEFYNRGYDNIFMVDDDVTLVSCLHKIVNSKGNISSVTDNSLNVFKVFAILQFAHEEICRIFDKYIITGITPKYFCYRAEFSDSKNSLQILHKSLIQLVAVNLKRLQEFGLEYNNSETHGHEDTELLFQILEKGCLTGCVEGITYLPGKLDSKMGFNTAEERFVTYWDRCIANHPDVISNKLISYKSKDTAHAHPMVHWRTGRKIYNPDYYANNKFDLFDILTNCDRYKLYRKD